MSYFEYNTGTGIVPEGHFKISPSQLSRFLDSTSQWYREFLLGEAPAFQGNTMSHLGTIVHAHAEAFAKGETIPTSDIASYIASIDNPDVDKSFIRDQYEVMSQALIDQFLSSNIPKKTELFLYKELIPGIGVGGSIDSIGHDQWDPTQLVIRDYKTTNSLNPPTGISRNYWFQQMAYVYLARMHGYNIRSFELVYITTNQVNRISEITGKPMKDYPTTVSTIAHQVTSEDIDIIESTLKLVAESVHAWNTQPEIRHLLAQDWRLRPSPKPRLFK